MSLSSFYIKKNFLHTSESYLLYWFSNCACANSTQYKNTQSSLQINFNNKKMENYLITARHSVK